MVRKQTLNKFIKKLEQDIQNTLATEVFDTVVDIQSQEIQNKVYDVYSPYRYERRGAQGGLLDARNNIATFSNTGSRIEMIIQNTTKGKNNGEYITPLIVGGDGYKAMEYDFKRNRDGTQDKYLKPRDFISTTMQRIQRTLEVHDALEIGLMKRGYKLK